MQGHILEYGYDALGVKRREYSQAAVAGIIVPMGEFTQVSMTPYPSQLDYCGNVIYGGMGGYAASLYTTEGYTRRSNIVSGNWEYYYTLKDHLGSVRSEFKVNGTTVTDIGYTHYYPSGIEITDPGWSQTLQSRERFNNKELLTAHGLNLLDYGARLYDGARGQWMTPDPLAEMYYSISPYAYCLNNPINRIDPDGRAAPLVIAAIALGKGALSAGVDAFAQVTVSLANGNTFKEAVSSIDGTSVGASFVIGALSAPGVSSMAKAVGIGVAVTADAVVDVSNSKGITSVVTGDKPVASSIVDAAASVLPGKAADSVISTANKAISSDLTSKSAATMTKETKNMLKSVQTTVNSESVKTGANAAADYTGGVVGGQINEEINKQ